MELKRSKDRKVTTLSTNNGKIAKIANSFGLPAGKNYSCRGETEICSKVCYAGKLEKLYTNVRKVLIHNWDLLSTADYSTQVNLISNMMKEFRSESEKWNAEKLFRIHWDGDFFSDEYAYAWKEVILSTPDVQYWVYTRVDSAARILQGIDNLSLYYSADNDNLTTAKKLSSEGIRLAYLADTFAMGADTLKGIIGKVGAKCPENAKQIPLIDSNGGACVSCGLCVHGKADIRFSATKK